MKKETITLKDTYDLIDKLLNLYQYHSEFYIKYINEIVKINNNKRFTQKTKDTKIKDLKDQQMPHLQEMEKIDTLLEKIRKNKILEINIKFM